MYQFETTDFNKAIIVLKTKANYIPFLKDPNKGYIYVVYKGQAEDLKVWLKNNSIGYYCYKLKI